jgi:NifB/MoaA-like Fe-S oxidoreductase
MHLSQAPHPILNMEDGRSVTVPKPAYDDLGLTFESFLMDAQRSCANRCVFCFIGQLPPGMRETLYFKDDDARLSFLMGNYISMTNIGAGHRPYD